MYVKNSNILEKEENIYYNYYIYEEFKHFKRSKEYVLLLLYI